ncbi:threonine aldolase family protein [Parasulfitobacter algicola]|uniref:Low specificity L-threonine aldolase n=1 Tax=Parasulfitobacter algicola TaxID=2614809 RepID=A0ABX2ISP4_9RHOB|nr:beta-eliminating lyase-related protein [Sulfitobacter algicola]NSX55932.1 low specificity L-threonine aldolase [Sulfitobacter algicola]
MFFASDNAGPVHPKVMESLVKANADYAMPYGSDPIMGTVREQVREVFEAPEAAVYLVATGTAANSIILATQANPWETIFCSRIAHIHEDECGCPEFFTGGAKLTLVDAPDGKMDPDALKVAIEGEETRGVHGPQRGPVSITQATEKGTVYSLSELKTLINIAKSYGQKTHMDGARFTNALVSLGCSAAEMTWGVGIDAVSFGGTKNGLMGVEAVVLFDPDQAWEFELRRKRAAHLFSKHRFLSAQMQAYLTDDLWLELATKANTACARLTRGLKQTPDTKILFEPGANMIFAEWPRAGHQRLHDAGAQYYIYSGALEGDDPDEPLMARLVCDWSATDENIDRFIDLVKG